jgi:hypothetical protein
MVVSPEPRVGWRHSEDRTEASLIFYKHLKVDLSFGTSPSASSRELFGWGRYGGFGASTKLIGEGLAERGAEVSVVVPKGEGQRPNEDVEGITVHSFPLRSYPFTSGIYRLCDSDVYHS